MGKLSLDRDKVDLAKHLAEQIVGPVQHLIERHTTDSMERSVLRLLGISGPADAKLKKAPPQGSYPLVGEVVKKIGPDRLKKGAAFWFGLVALQHPGEDAGGVARLIAEGKVDLDALEKRPVKEIDGVCQKFLRPQLDRLRQVREHRHSRPDWGTSNQPLRYLIVATGNIHEDIVQAQAAAEMGADIIAVIRSTAQSLLDYVPEGATTEGYGGTYATQENFRLMRSALDETEKKLDRRIALCNYSSGLCMPEIAVIGALEGVDYLLNDAMYGILFRDINMKRNFVDQYFSRRICALSGITIQTGEDNYLTTAESFKYWYQVLASHFINHAFAKRAGIVDSALSLGHAFEMNPEIEDSFLYEWSQAQLVRDLFPRSPIKFMPPTRHKTGDIFQSYLLDGMFNLVGAMSGQSIQLLGMHTEAIHNPFVQDRHLSLKNANYIFNAAKNAKEEVSFVPNGKVNRRARQVLDDAIRMLKKIKMRGLPRAIEEGAFANVKRAQEAGKGSGEIYAKDRYYYTPLQNYLKPKFLREDSSRNTGRGGSGRRGLSGPRKTSRGSGRRYERKVGDRRNSERSRPSSSRGNTRPNREAAPKRRELRAESKTAAPAKENLESQESTQEPSATATPTPAPQSTSQSAAQSTPQPSSQPSAEASPQETPSKDRRESRPKGERDSRRGGRNQGRGGGRNGGRGGSRSGSRNNGRSGNGRSGSGQGRRSDSNDAAKPVNTTTKTKLPILSEQELQRQFHKEMLEREKGHTAGKAFETPARPNAAPESSPQQSATSQGGASSLPRRELKSFEAKPAAVSETNAAPKAKQTTPQSAPAVQGAPAAKESPAAKAPRRALPRRELKPKESTKD